MKRIILSTIIVLGAQWAFAQNLRIADEAPVTAQAASEKIHIVTKGETLYGISKKYSVTVDQIKSANQLTSSSISQGQRLYISKITPSNSGTNANARLAGNANARMRSGDNAPATNINYDYYVIKKGDDIFSISDTKEISVAKLKEMNPEASFVVGERIAVGEKAMPASSVASNQRVAYTSPASNARVASSSVPAQGVMRGQTNTAARMQPKSVSIPQKGPETVKASSGEVYEMPVFNIYGQVATQVRYGEVSDNRVNSTRFYAYHKTLPLGTKVNLLLPENAGFIELEIVGRLNANSTAELGLSPDCVQLVKGASANDLVTITYN